MTALWKFAAPWVLCVVIGALIAWHAPSLTVWGLGFQGGAAARLESLRGDLAEMAAELKKSEAARRSETETARRAVADQLGQCRDRLARAERFCTALDRLIPTGGPTDDFTRACDCGAGDLMDAGELRGVFPDPG